MAVALSDTLTERWASGKHLGAARPTQRVRVQRGYWQRGDAAHVGNPFGYDWTQWWVPRGEWIEVPGVRRVDLQQALASNGCCTATIELANFAMIEEAGLGGTYHRRAPGWMSPTRAYAGPSAESPDPVDAAVNEWSMVFYEAVRIRIDQGYGDEMVPQFDGLLDSGDGRSRDTSITLVARDHVNLLLDSHVFGWNTDPAKVEAFVSEQWVDSRENSSTPGSQQVGQIAREKWIVCTDLSIGVRVVMEWCGLSSNGIRLTGIHNWKEPQKFSRGEYLMDIIKAAQAACGFVWFMGQPRAEGTQYELGRPTFRRSKSYVVPASTFTVADVDLVTDLQWSHTYEMLAAIIRVRGKETPPADGGVTLGTDRTTRVMGIYRPPWHTEERDARKIRHVIHTESKLKTVEECTLMAMLIALNEALEANTARVEIPAYPGLELDDIFTVRDTITGISSRCWVAAKQQTFNSGEETTFTQSLSVALLDSPDVVEVIDDIATFLDSIPVVIDTDAQPITSGPRSGSGGTGSTGGTGGSGTGGSDGAGGGGSGGGTGGETLLDSFEHAADGLQSDFPEWDTVFRSFADRIQTVTSADGAAPLEGTYALKVTANNADTNSGPWSGSTAIGWRPPTINPRAQLQGFPGDESRAGAETYYHFAVLFPVGGPNIPSSAWSLFQQFHGPPFSASPNFAMSIGGGGVTNRIVMTNDVGIRKVLWNGPTPIPRGVWHEFTYRIKWSYGSDGFVELWHNGVQQTLTNGLTRWTGQTLKSDQADGVLFYLSNYRQLNAVPGDVTYYYDAFRAGPSYSSVQRP